MLFLIPVPLGDTPAEHVLPNKVSDVVNSLNEFIVENPKTARRYLRKMGYSASFDETIFHVLNKHTSPAEFSGFLNAARNGGSIGLLSEAGCPAIADPGADIVAQAHRDGIKVVPLTGPSSILLALIGSGFNGQSFAFNGYLPREKPLRIKKIKELEELVYRSGQTQIFMETPYRNMNLLEDVLKHCKPQTMLCIASEITLPGESIRSQPVGSWRKRLPEIHKKPAIFLLQKG